MSEIKSNTLFKPVIAISPGHGGIDPGAVYKDVTEAQITYPWALGFQLMLKYGFNIESYLLFTETESFERKKAGKKFQLAERIQRTEDVKANIFISVHVNAVESSQAYGSEVWIHTADKENDLELATKLATALSGKDLKNRGVKYTGKESGEHGLYVLRKTLDIPSVLLEIGFLSNDGDRKYIVNSKTVAEQIWRSALALAFWCEKNYNYMVPLWVNFLYRDQEEDE